MTNFIEFSKHSEMVNTKFMLYMNLQVVTLYKKGIIMDWLQTSALCLAVSVTSVIFTEKAMFIKVNGDE